MKVIFLGCTKFSYDLLSHLLDHNIPINSVFYIPEYFNISYSDEPVRNYNYYDIASYSKENEIPSYEVNSVKGKKITDYKNIISEIDPDVILVMGWYYMVPKSIRELAKYGAWGIHASLLPKYAGGAPLVWAMIHGEKETGVSLFKLDSGVDDGDIIAQDKIEIKDSDTIKEVYEKATKSSKKILLDSVKNMHSIQPKPQDKSKIEIFPQRKPADGEIDLTLPSQQLYNFIRAQSAPYPGAFIRTTDGKKLIIDKARLED